ncbi:hypothetical protein SAMN04487997_1417 [Frateuria terrea]|uniref:Uncharacterized protein n=1 Tax=Frateuria terrea TaxID=529704 RepID=A0A1H6STQ4_9GAMM|nr:hypothetical protein SAMN04487997_1417 [Frateuria terrea]SFP26530.1 hypothetical protein SAMN02927913_1332 [Frateuria terrea]
MLVLRKRQTAHNQETLRASAGFSFLESPRCYQVMGYSSLLVRCAEGAKEASSHAFTDGVAANHPRLPGNLNISIGKRPACRALYSASVVG